ncbi:MAG: hypothetical protein ACOH2R_11375 [Pseudomonas sp.]
MISIDLGSTNSVGFQAATLQTKAVALESNPLGDTPPVGVKVELSSAGIAKANSAQSNSDDSTNPIKVLEKRMKEIQKQIAEAQAQLQAIEANKSLTANEKQAESGAIEATLAQLNAALTTASNALVKLEEQQGQ